MSKPKFSLKNMKNYESFMLERAGEYLSVSIYVAEFIERKDLAEQLRHIRRYEFRNYKNLYSIIPLPVIKQLLNIITAIKMAAFQFINRDYELLPEAMHLLTPENEKIFSITESEDGHKTYNLFNCLNKVDILENYFQQAIDLNREIEYGKYT